MTREKLGTTARDNIARRAVRIIGFGQTYDNLKY